MQTQAQTADESQKMRTRHRYSKRAKEDANGVDEADVGADTDRADNAGIGTADDAGIGTADADGAADDLAQAQQTQTKRTRYRQQTSHRRRGGSGRPRHSRRRHRHRRRRRRRRRRNADGADEAQTANGADKAQTRRKPQTVTVTVTAKPDVLLKSFAFLSTI